jgi:hypothetical protein
MYLNNYWTLKKLIQHMNNQQKWFVFGVTFISFKGKFFYPDEKNYSGLTPVQLSYFAIF